MLARSNSLFLSYIYIKMLVKLYIELTDTETHYCSLKTVNIPITK